MSKEQLIDVFNKFNETNTFAPGDIVEWKPGLRNRRTPGPFIVMEVLDHPIFDSEPDTGSPYFREPLDVVLGFILDKDEQLYGCHFDSRRLRHAE